MPLPNPKTKQSRESFVNSCMSSDVMKKEYPNNKQRLAVCFSQYKRAKNRKNSKGAIEEPKWEDNDLDGFTFLP